MSELGVNPSALGVNPYLRVPLISLEGMTVIDLRASPEQQVELCQKDEEEGAPLPPCPSSSSSSSEGEDEKKEKGKSGGGFGGGGLGLFDDSPPMFIPLPTPPVFDNVGGGVVGGGPVGESQEGAEGGGAGAALGAAGAATIAKDHNMLVPKKDDEPGAICTLSGCAITCYAELCGWTGMTPIKFFNLTPTTYLYPMTDDRGDLLSAAQILMSQVITLKQMASHIGTFLGDPVEYPILATVVAKREVDLSTKNHQLLINPQVIIADQSGYCILSSINEGLATVYNQLDFGDQVLISRCIPLKPSKPYHKGLFPPEEMYLDLDIKIQYPSERKRRHYLQRYDPINVIHQFKMPLRLYEEEDPSKRDPPPGPPIKIPSELEKEFKNTGGIFGGTLSPDHRFIYYDLVGVVVYVGRIERCQDVNNAPETLEILESGELNTKDLRRFNCYRWIYLVDKVIGKPLTVKITVNHLTSEKQEDLVPGQVIIISYCQTVECPFSGRFVISSPFSQLFLEGTPQITKYLKSHPPFFEKKINQIRKPENYSLIMTRYLNQLVIGGTHQPKILKPDNFLNYFAENLDKIWRTIPEDRPMRRRESRRFCFEGVILRALEIKEQLGPPRVCYIDKDKYNLQFQRKRTVYKQVIENFVEGIRYPIAGWYAFQRKLKPFNETFLKDIQLGGASRRIVEKYRDLCRPLLMPAEMPGGEDGEEEAKVKVVPEMGKLERLDGAPYLVLDIVNEEGLIWYTVIWKSRQFKGIQEMMRRLNGAKGQKIVALADVHCTEVEAPLEVNLLDFVVNRNED